MEDPSPDGHELALVRPEKEGGDTKGRGGTIALTKETIFILGEYAQSVAMRKNPKKA